jgi:glucosylceramidase
MADVRLLGWDHNRDGIERRADALFGDPEASRYLWGVALHWYISEDYAASSRVRAKYPDKPIVFTEGCWEAGAALGVWRHGEGYARQMMGDFRNGVSGWIDWNIVLDARGGPNHVGNFCDAPVIVDTATGEVRYQSGFYYIGHFSRFVRVGAERIASEGAPAGLNAIAFRNPDGGVVVVVLNETDDPVIVWACRGGRVKSRLSHSRARHPDLHDRPLTDQVRRPGFRAAWRKAAFTDEAAKVRF